MKLSRRISLMVAAVVLGVGAVAHATDLPHIMVFNYPSNDPPTITTFSVSPSMSRTVLIHPGTGGFDCGPMYPGFDTESFACNNDTNGFCQECGP